MIKKEKIAVLFGGNSTEYDVSLQSAYAVFENLNKEKYEIIPVGITKEGEWYYYNGNYDNIRQNLWIEDREHLFPCMVSQNRKIKGIMMFMDNQYRLLETDRVFPVLHGKNGEDGTVQGLFELAGIPVIGCDTLSSAICMDKDKAHKLVSMEGIGVPESITFTESEKMQRIKEINEKFTYPLFVKPVCGGSSIGMRKIHHQDELESAVNYAFKYHKEVIVEKEVKGFEVGCAVLGNENPLAGRVDEVELSCDFFDYREKYTQKASQIHMPARITSATEERIRDTALKIYRILDCSDFARVDMFLTPQGEIIFNEVNTIPGLTCHSRYPKMLAGIGITFSEMLDKIIELP